MVKYFWDTYALVLLLKGDPRVLPYAQEKGVTSTLNIVKLCAYLLRNEIECDQIVEKIREAFTIIEKIPFKTVVSAAKLRHRMRKKGRHWSYIDSIGYLLAKEIGAKFLTGDREFKGIENVEFLGK